MKNRIEELLNEPRMYYYEFTPQNSVRGLLDLIHDVVNADTKMVEIGSFSGISTELFALHCKEITCVDLWSPYSEIGVVELIEGESRFNKLLDKYSNIIKLKMSSKDASFTFEDKSLDFIYIDAAHDYGNAKTDILSWKSKVKDGGYIGGHDIGIGGVHMAVTEIFGSTYTTYDDTSWLIKC